MLRNLITSLVAVLLMVGHALAESPEGLWRVTFEMDRVGTLDAAIEFEGTADIQGHHASPASPGPVMVLRAADEDPGTMTGRLTTPFGNARVISISLTDNHLTGSFEGDINGTVTGAPFAGDLPLRDYASVLRSIDAVTNAWLYDLRYKETPEWTQFHDGLVKATTAAQDDFDMISGFQNAWGEGLFSHYELLRPLKSMDALLQQADRQSEDKPIVHTFFSGDNIGYVAIDSFFGSRIEEQIDNAFKEVIVRNPQALIIDVRRNGGGTLSAWPVASRLLQEEVLGGYFISNRWWSGHSELPSTETLLATPSPAEVTPRAFQQDLFSDGLLVMRVAPTEKTYDGPVYILVSARSRSATEALIGVLQFAGRVEVIGETTAGYMLNSNLFEIAEGFTLRVPVADFFLPDHKSLEGVGVVPDIPTPPEKALDMALHLIRTDEPER